MEDELGVALEPSGGVARVEVAPPLAVERIDVGVEQLGVTHTDRYDVAALLAGD